jgi:hypothetical protein
MSSIYNPGGGESSGGFKQPKQRNQTEDQVQNLGKIAFNVARPGESIRQSAENLTGGFINLGKGLVSVAENVPILGAIAKPAIGLVGGAVDLTIGNVVRAAQGVKVGDSNLAQKAVEGLEIFGAPIAIAAEAAAIPGREVEKAVARARVQAAATNKNDAISAIFGLDGLQQYRGLNLDQAELDDIAEALASTNAGFSSNGAANLFYSLVIDPLNLISFGTGSGLKTASKAGRLATSGLKEARAGILADRAIAESAGNANRVVALDGRLARLDADIQFLEKNNIAGQLHNAATSKLKGISRFTAATVAKEMAMGFTRVVNTRTLGKVFDSMEPTFVNNALKNYAQTVKYATGAAAIRMATASRRRQSLAASESYVTQLVEGVRSGLRFEDVLSMRKPGYVNLKNILYSARKGQMKLAKEEKELVKRLERTGASVDQIKESRLRLRESKADETKLLDEEIYKLEAVLKKRVEEKSAIATLTPEDIIRLPDVAPIIDDIERIMTTGRVRKEQSIIRYEAEAAAASDVRIASEEATRVLRESKMDVYDMVASKSPEAIEQVAAWMAAGSGMSIEAARREAAAIFATYADDIETLADIAAFFRGSAFGEASRKLARIVTLFDDGEEFSKMTIVSKRTLTQDVAEELVPKFKKLKDELESVRDLPRDQRAMFNRSVDDIEAELQALANDVAKKYDEISLIHGNGRKYDWRQISDYVEQGARNEVFAVRLTADDFARIYAKMDKDPRLEAMVSIGYDIVDAGYNLGKAPKNGLRKIITVVDDPTRGERIVETVVPFVDNLAETAIEELDGLLGKTDLRPSRTRTILESVHRQYGAEITKSRATEAFVGKMVSKANLSVGEARELLTRINRLAADIGTQPRGLYWEKNKVYEEFLSVLGEKRYSEYLTKGNEPIVDIIDASGGDMSVFGATTALSTRAKTKMPAVTMMTDRLFPMVRFGELNPFFQRILERVETSTMKLVYNIWDDASDEVLGELGVTARRRAFLDRGNVNRERADNFVEHHTRLVKATAAAAESSPSFINRAKKFLLKPGQAVLDEKDTARNLMADRFAAEEFLVSLGQMYPEIMPKLIQHFGVQSPQDALRLLLEESIIKTDPNLLAKKIAEEGAVMTGLSVKALVDGGMELADAERLVGVFTGVWRTQLIKGTRKADTLQYFATQRSWLERSLNHPFLGIYPYSYMTRKAIPAMMRLLFLTPGPGGRVLPLVGLNSWGDIVEWADNRANSDGSFLDSLAEDDSFLYILQTIAPITPDAMGFSTIPTYIRRTLVQPAARGKEIGIGDFATGIGTGALQQVGRGTVLGQVPNIFEGIQSAGEKIESDAEQVQREIFNVFTSPQ